MQSIENKVQAERQAWESERAIWQARANSFLSKHEQLERDHQVPDIQHLILLHVFRYPFGSFSVYKGLVVVVLNSINATMLAKLIKIAVVSHYAVDRYSLIMSTLITPYIYIKESVVNLCKVMVSTDFLIPSEP